MKGIIKVHYNIIWIWYMNAIKTQMVLQTMAASQNK